MRHFNLVNTVISLYSATVYKSNSGHGDSLLKPSSTAMDELHITVDISR